MMSPQYNVISSGYKVADAVIFPSGSTPPPNGAALHGVMLLSDGTHTASLIVYDNNAASAATQVATFSIPANIAAPQYIMFNNPIICNKGIYADVTGTSATYIIYYSIGV